MLRAAIQLATAGVELQHLVFTSSPPVWQSIRGFQRRTKRQIFQEKSSWQKVYNHNISLQTKIKHAGEEDN
jgi:hypothetical protein